MTDEGQDPMSQPRLYCQSFLRGGKVAENYWQYRQGQTMEAMKPACTKLMGNCSQWLHPSCRAGTEAEMGRRRVSGPIGGREVLQNKCNQKNILKLIKHATMSVRLISHQMRVAGAEQKWQCRAESIFAAQLTLS